MARRRMLIGLTVVGMAVPVSLPAQVPTDSAAKKSQDSLKQAVAPDTGGGSRALFTRNDLLYTGGLIGGTALISLLDRPVAQNLGDSTKIPSAFRTNAAKALNFLGFPGSFFIAGGMYVVGKVGSVPGLARTGVHTGEALVIGEALAEVLKWSFGRERPFFAGTSNPGDFSFGRGLKGDVYSSLPSGHAVAAFATAAAVTAEVSARWPKATYVVAPVLYTGAAMVGWARLSNNVHWISDVFLGAGIGTFAGVKVVRYTHKHPNNFMDRIFVGSAPTVLPDMSTGQMRLRLMWTWQPKLLERDLLPQ